MLCFKKCKGCIWHGTCLTDTKKQRDEWSGTRNVFVHRSSSSQRMVLFRMRGSCGYCNCRYIAFILINPIKTIASSVFSSLFLCRCIPPPPPSSVVVRCSRSIIQIFCMHFFLSTSCFFVSGISHSLSLSFLFSTYLSFSIHTVLILTIICAWIIRFDAVSMYMSLLSLWMCKYILKIWMQCTNWMREKKIHTTNMKKLPLQCIQKHKHTHTYMLVVHASFYG